MFTLQATASCAVDETALYRKKTNDAFILCSVVGSIRVPESTEAKLKGPFRKLWSGRVRSKTQSGRHLGLVQLQHYESQ